MEAPEKIYFTSTENGTHYYTEGMPFERESIEYVHKDAFIEKACDAYCRLCDTKECGGTCECDWVEKFRKRLMK